MLAPTPWTAEPDAEEDQIEGDARAFLVIDANGEVVADCGILGRSKAEQEAHAAFIALAPMLLAALKKSARNTCYERCPSGSHYHDHECVEVTRLLDQAEMAARGSVVEAIQPGRARGVPANANTQASPVPGAVVEG